MNRTSQARARATGGVVAACVWDLAGGQSAEELPFADDAFDASLAQLVVLVHLDAGMSRPGGLDEWRRRVDGRHRSGAQPCNERRRERPGAAADVEHPLSGGDAAKIRQLRGQQARVSAHEAVVRLRGDIEAHGPTVRSSTRSGISRSVLRW
jgi:hypothetical protein